MQGKIENEAKTEFAKKFYEVKLEKEITYREIKAVTGLSIGYLSDIAAGRKPVPEMPIVRQIEDVLGITDRSLQMAAVNSRKKSYAELEAEHALMERILECASIQINADGSHQFKPKAVKFYCEKITAEENERLKQELARRDEAGAVMRNTAGKQYDLMFICSACNRRSIFTNRILNRQMRCSVCSHDEFEVEAMEKEK